jgi:hypothetical protein
LSMNMPQSYPLLCRTASMFWMSHVCTSDDDDFGF